MDAFLGADMGECNMFDMGNVTSSQDVSITLYHALKGMMEKGYPILKVKTFGKIIFGDSIKILQTEANSIGLKFNFRTSAYTGKNKNMPVTTTHTCLLNHKSIFL